MQKIKYKILVTILLLTLVTTVIPLFILTTDAQVTGTPTQFIEYSNAWAQATVAVPNIGNITGMTVTPVHQNKSSTTDDYEVLSLVLTSNLTANALVASISTNTNDSDVAWRQALRNGSTAYLNINGTENYNNLKIVNPTELTINKNVSGSTVSISVDFKRARASINVNQPDSASYTISTSKLFSNLDYTCFPYGLGRHP